MPRACVSSTHLMSKPFFLPERLGVSKAPVLPAGPGAEPAAPGRATDSLVAAEDTQQVLGAEIRGEVVDLDDMGQLVIAEVRRGRLGPVVVEAGLLQALPALLAPRELRGGRGMVLSDPSTSTCCWINSSGTLGASHQDAHTTRLLFPLGAPHHEHGDRRAPCHLPAPPPARHQQHHAGKATAPPGSQFHRLTTCAATNLCLISNLNLSGFSFQPLVLVLPLCWIQEPWVPGVPSP